MNQRPLIRTGKKFGAIALMALLFSILIWGTPIHAQGGSYTVQPGDTLSEIAARNGTDTASLMQLNGLSSGRYIWIGQTLTLSGSASATSYGASGGSGSGYVVQPGDTLSEIAAHFGDSVENLRALNDMTPYSSLLAGSTLVVSGSGVTSAQATTTSYSNSNYEASGDTHIVQRGESLGAIAAQYGTSVEIISSANGLANASLIVLGQSLHIPAGTAASVTSSAASSTTGGTSYRPTSGKWIDVDLSNQQVVAYEDGALISAFTISSGLPRYPTVTGAFRIWSKTPVQDMSGGSRASGEAYYLKDVRWVQYFHEDYAFHAADWHSRFGQPMSRGCINMRPDDAKWLYDWAGPGQVANSGLSYASSSNPGTLVVVHY